MAIEFVRQKPVSEYEVEIVERKGLGHPDYIADSIAEQVSRSLCKYYIEEYGDILHHNVDKVLVVGGQSAPAFKGGKVIRPIYVLVSGRVTTEVEKCGVREEVPVGPLIIGAAREWLRDNFRFLDVDKHLAIDYRIGRGSADLRAIFEMRRSMRSPLANDTSVGAAFAPLTKTEELVLSAERYLNSKEFKSRVPQVGEDVKVMGLRIGSKVELTVAAAMISHLIEDGEHYMDIKEGLREEVRCLARKMIEEDVEVHVNTADKPEDGIYYIVVTGTSAEHGDDGSSGRGNRVNGLITPMRLISLEATAGKNPVSHVGKVYNIVARRIADKAYHTGYIKEIYVHLLSQIGRPIDDPWMKYVRVIPEDGVGEGTIRSEVEGIIEEELNPASLARITEEIVRGKVELF